MRGRRWIALMCAATSVTCTRATSESFPLRSKTLAALGTTRPYDARVSAAQPYRPCEIADSTALHGTGLLCRPTGEKVAAQTAEIAVEVSNALARQSTTDALWSAALLDLWSARLDASSIDRAIHRLLEVSARDSVRAHAAVLNDLAVAHLARASARSDARDLFTALDYAERAYASDSASEVVRFNRAIVLERLRIDAQAADAWRELAKASRGWGREAEVRRGRLSGATSARPFSFVIASEPSADSSVRLVAADPQGAREFVLDSLVPTWASAMTEGDAKTAERALRRGGRIGESLIARSADSSVAHIIRELESGAPLAGPLRRGTSGIASYQQTRYIEAQPELEASVRGLRSLHAVALADWIELTVGGLAIYRAEYSTADGIFAGIASRAAGRKDIALEARAHWGFALSGARRGAMSEVENASLNAAAAFEHLGETSNYGFMKAIIAEIHAALGRMDESANDSQAALEALHRSQNPGQRYALLLGLGARLTDRRQPYAAGVMVREAAIEAGRTGRAKDLPEALARLAATEANLDNPPAAKGAVSQAHDLLGTVEDSVMHSRLAAEVARAEAQVYRKENPSLAVERLGQVIAYFAATKIPSDEAAALVDRAVIRLSLGDSTKAETDLADAAARVTAFAGRSASRETVRRLLATQRDAYRQLVAIAIARGDTTAAYRYTSLLHAGSRTSRTARSHETRAESGTAVLEYITLHDRTFLWTTTARGRRLFSIESGEKDIADLAARLINLIRQGDDTLTERHIAGRLDELLFGPVRALLATDGVRRLVLLTDGPLSDLPFAALRGADGRHLVEKFSLAYARNTSLVEGRSARPQQLRDALFVGSPSWDRALFPELDALRKTDDEVRVVSALYSKPSVLSADAASRSAVLREISQHDIAHFAGHARVVRENPQASHLVLAKSTGGFGANVLFASEIADLRLERVHLVVLSACGDARKEFALSEGNGLVEAFLDAGAGAVIASQWEADDDGTAALTRELHRELRAGIAPDEALRGAQLALLGGRAGAALSALRMWAGFRYTEDGDREK